MAKSNKPVGRPRGSGIIDDEADMAEVANMVAFDPGLKPTSAMRAVMQMHEFKTEAMKATVLRRWQRRWQKDKDRYLAAARLRYPNPVDASSTGTYPMSSPIGDVAMGLTGSRKLGAIEEFFANQRRLDELLKPMEQFDRLMKQMDPFGPHTATGRFMQQMDRIIDDQERMRRMLFPFST